MDYPDLRLTIDDLRLTDFAARSIGTLILSPLRSESVSFVAERPLSRLPVAFHNAVGKASALPLS